MQKDLTEVKIFQKVLGGYFFETPCSYKCYILLLQAIVRQLARLRCTVCLEWTGRARRWPDLSQWRRTWNLHAATTTTARPGVRRRWRSTETRSMAATRAASFTTSHSDRLLLSAMRPRLGFEANFIASALPKPRDLWPRPRRSKPWSWRWELLWQFSASSSNSKKK